MNKIIIPNLAALVEFLVIWKNRSADDPYLIKDIEILKYAFKIHNFISTGTLLYTCIK